MVSYFRIVTAIESRAAPRSLMKNLQVLNKSANINKKEIRIAACLTFMIIILSKEIHPLHHIQSVMTFCKILSCQLTYRNLFIGPWYSLVPFRRHGSINRHNSFIQPYTFPKI